MGGSQSSPIPGGGTEGYHVLRVQDNSPGQKAGLEAFFDFIICIGNTRLNQDNELLKDLLKVSIDRPVNVVVYSSKTGKLRNVELVPTQSWGGQGLLGVSIRFCSFEGANENVWHVLEVEPNSPAALAGLKSDSDYIIGSDTPMQESEDLFALIECHEGRPLRLYVYNTEVDKCREVTITPNSSWGGPGSLGCGIGYGYLHRIPVRAPSLEMQSIKIQGPDGNAAFNGAPNRSTPHPEMSPPGYSEAPLSVPAADVKTSVGVSVPPQDYLANIGNLIQPGLTTTGVPYSFSSTSHSGFNPEIGSFNSSFNPGSVPPFNFANISLPSHLSFQNPSLNAPLMKFPPGVPPLPTQLPLPTSASLPPFNLPKFDSTSLSSVTSSSASFSSQLPSDLLEKLNLGAAIPGAPGIQQQSFPPASAPVAVEESVATQQIVQENAASS